MIGMVLFIALMAISVILNGVIALNPHYDDHERRLHGILAVASLVVGIAAIAIVELVF